MCYRTLICIVERSIYIFTLSNGKKKKKKKIPIQSLTEAWFFMIWTLLGLGRDMHNLRKEYRLINELYLYVPLPPKLIKVNDLHL